MKKIKICGLRRAEDVRIVNQYLPEYIGFVFAEGRRRTVSLEQAKSLKKELLPEIQAVGVFLNQETSLIEQAVREKIIDLIQLHGQENEQYLEDLRKALGESCPKIIKAFAIESKEDIKEAMQSSADFILLDNKLPGSGESFDWSLLGAIPRPFFLAGGISPENVKEALKSGAWALDVSSGVETNGDKDSEKIQILTEKIREDQEDE